MENCLRIVVGQLGFILALLILLPNATYMYSDNPFDLIHIEATEAPNPLPSLGGVAIPDGTVIIEEGYLLIEIVWSIKPFQMPANYIVYKNEANITESVPFDNGKKVNIDITSLVIGEYNYTIYVNNSIGEATDTVILNVLPTAPPVITPKVDNETAFELYKIGNDLVWNINDTYITDISLYQTFNEITTPMQQLSYASPTSYVSLIESLDSISEIGIYNYTVEVTDYLDLISTESLYIEIVANKKPIFVDMPLDFTYTYLETGNFLNWTLSDASPLYYDLFKNDLILLSNQTWLSDVRISIPVDGLNIGAYNFTIVIYDNYTLNNNDTVFIEVVTIDTTIPVLVISQSFITGFEESISGNWNASDSSPMINSLISAHLKDAADNSVSSFSDQLDNLGQFNQLLNYTNIPSGNYTWEFTYSKFGYTTRRLSIPITISPQVFDLQVDIDLEFVQNSTFSANATVSVPSSSLSLDIATSIEGIGVEFILSVIYGDNSTGFISKTISSDANGIAYFILTPDETKLIFDLTSLSVSLANNGFAISNNVNFDDSILPVVEIIILPTTLGTTPTDDTSTPTTSPPQEFDFLPILYAFAVIFLIIILLIFIKKEDLKIYFNKHHQANRKEYQYLRSLRRVILRTSSGLPIFERSSEETNMDTHLISGITTAISSFLGEIEGIISSGFEVVKRANLVITSHRSEISTLIVLSSQEMDQNILDILEKSHFDIDNELVLSDLITNIERGVITSELLLSVDIMFTKIFSSNGIRMELLAKLMMNNENFDELLESSSINGKIKSLILMLKEFTSPNNNFVMDDILDFYSDRDISDMLSVSALFAAFEMGVISQVY